MNTESSSFTAIVGGTLEGYLDDRVDTGEGTLAEQMADNICTGGVGLMDDGGWLTTYATMMYAAHRMLRMSRNAKVVWRLGDDADDKAVERERSDKGTGEIVRDERVQNGARF